jgi:hypothetical protein
VRPFCAAAPSYALGFRLLDASPGKRHSYRMAAVCLAYEGTPEQVFIADCTTVLYEIQCVSFCSSYGRNVGAACFKVL